MAGGKGNPYVREVCANSRRSPRAALLVMVGTVSRYHKLVCFGQKNLNSLNIFFLHGSTYSRQMPQTSSREEHGS